jgi:HNH endonuclease/AP2 domain
MISHDDLMVALSYDDKTGKFQWNRRVTKKSKTGSAGAIDSDGYRVIRIDRRNYKAHRLAWFYHYGVWPSSLIDHENGDRDDNRISNLREANVNQNVHNSKKPINNTSGFKGVSLAYGRWQARIAVGRKRISLGCFSTASEAALAYEKAAQKYHGEFARVQ